MTDAVFLDWIRTQPSCISGVFSEWLEDGAGRCLAAHIRRASNSGVALKPAFRAVPMTYREHALQHQHGELTCLQQFKPEMFLGVPPHARLELAKSWFDQQAEKYRKEWERINSA